MRGPHERMFVRLHVRACESESTNRRIRRCVSITGQFTRPQMLGAVQRFVDLFMLLFLLNKGNV